MHMMNFCSSLVHDINFEPTAVQPCCDVHGVEVPRFPFTGGRLDMAAYAAHVEKSFQRLQARGDRLCRNCPELREIPDNCAGNMRILFQTVSINMHRHLCNCKCVYCSLWRGKGKGYPIVPVLQSLHEQHVLHPRCLFSWGGGEPSILHDFEEASLWIKGHGWWQYVHTSCLRFSPAIATLLHEGLGGINVSLDSGTPSTYEWVKGLNGFAKVCGNLERYMSSALIPDNVHLKYIIFELNNSPAEIRAFLAFCSQLGISNVQYSLNFQELNGAGPSQKTLLGAVFFQFLATEMNMKCAPSFIPPKWQQAIDELRAKHFPT